MKRLIFAVPLFFTMILGAQNTMYFMEYVPQNVGLNPAFMPKMDSYVRLPFMGGVSAQVYNSGFNYNELDKFITGLDNENYNPDDFIKSIGGYNHATAELNVNLLSFGFKLKDKGYLSFMIGMNSILSNKASSDIAYFLADLDNFSREDFPIIIKDVYLLQNNYINFGFTYSRKINENLTLGISPRINFNQFGLSTSDINFKVDYIETEPDYFDYDNTFSGKMLLGLPTALNPDAINNGELDLDAGLLPENWLEDLAFSDIFQNKSLSVNIGATYSLEKWTFSASLLNLGSSHWQTNAYQLNGSNDIILVNEDEKAKVGIPTKVYAGAIRQFSPKWNYGLLLNSNFYKSVTYTTATLSLNGSVGKWLSTSASYTAGYKYNNIGVGLRLRYLPGMDMYLITDNIIQAIDYKNAYRLTAAMGFNLTFGLKKATKEIENSNSM